MKQIVLLLLTLSLVACGTTKTSPVASKRVIKGDWNLNSIVYSQAGEFNVTLLNDASKACFEGSTWSFVPNNNTGTYAISGASCTEGTRYFNFAIQKIDKETGLFDFLLKPTDNKGDSETNHGFRLKLASMSETEMVWQQTLSVDTAPFVITWKFTK